MLRATCIANPISIAFAFETGLQMLHEESLTAAISSSVGAKGRMFKSWLSISDMQIACYIGSIVTLEWRPEFAKSNMKRLVPRSCLLSSCSLRNLCAQMFPNCQPAVQIEIHGIWHCQEMVKTEVCRLTWSPVDGSLIDLRRYCRTYCSMKRLVQRTGPMKTPRRSCLPAAA